MAGLRTVGWGYNQRGLVATVNTLEPNHTAWQRFIGTGPIALLPVRSGYSNIVWSTSPRQVIVFCAFSSGVLLAVIDLIAKATYPRVLLIIWFGTQVI